MKSDDIEILKNVVCPLKETITSLIEKHATRDGKSNVDKELALTRIYSPHKYNLPDFEPYIDWVHTLGFSEKRAEPSMVWGLTYIGDDFTYPHDHNPYRITGIHYLRAEEGCGLLQFPETVIEPEEDMIVTAPGWKMHSVLPAENPEARRTCIVFNLL